MKSKRFSKVLMTCGLAVAMIGQVVGAQSITAQSYDVIETSAKEINLEGLSHQQIKNIYEEYGLIYHPEYKYEKLVIQNPTSRATHNGEVYLIVNEYYSKPIKEVKKEGMNAITGAILDRGVSVAVGLTKPYLWIPYTILGITPSQIGVTNSPQNYVMTQVYTHMTNSCIQFVPKGGTSFRTYAMSEKASIESTTTAYLLVDKTQDKYKSYTEKETEVRYGKYYNNRDYLVKKAYEYWGYGGAQYFIDPA